MGEGQEGVVPFWATEGGGGGVGSAMPLRRRAPHIGHGTHLCHMAESGEFTLEQIKSVIGTPKFICKVCGRVAEKEENLCEPRPM